MLLSPTYGSVESSLAQWIISHHRLPEEAALLLLLPISGIAGMVISKRDIVGCSMRTISRRISGAHDISLLPSFPPVVQDISYNEESDDGHGDEARSDGSAGRFSKVKASALN